MKRSRKLAAKLQRRIKDFEAMMAESNDRTGRKGSGGYHKPGSKTK